MSKHIQCYFLMSGQMAIIVGWSTEAVFGKVEAILFSKTDNLNIKHFTKPVGSSPKTSLSLRGDCTASICSNFKTNHKSLASASKSTS